MTSTIQTTEKLERIAKYESIWSYPKSLSSRMFVPSVSQITSFLENKGFTVDRETIRNGGKISGGKAFDTITVKKDGVSVFGTHTDCYRYGIELALFAAHL